MIYLGPDAHELNLDAHELDAEPHELDPEPHKSSCVVLRRRIFNFSW